MVRSDARGPMPHVSWSPGRSGSRSALFASDVMRCLRSWVAGEMAAGEMAAGEVAAGEKVAGEEVDGPRSVAVSSSPTIGSSGNARCSIVLITAWAE